MGDDNRPSTAIVGCGYVGMAAATRLVERGHRVWGVRRGKVALPDGVSLVRADVTEEGWTSRLPSDLDYIVYAVSPDDRDEQAYRAAYVTGVAAVLGGRWPGLARFIFTGSTAVYGQRGGEWVDEDSNTQPERVTARILLEGEALVRERAPAHTTIRFGGIYGPGRVRLIDRVRRGEAVCPHETRYTNRIHRDDAAGAIVHLIERDRMGRDVDPLYVGVDADPASICEVYRWLVSRMGAPPPPVATTTTKGRGSKRCRHTRLVRSGYAFEYPTYREGYAAMLESESTRCT